MSHVPPPLPRTPPHAERHIIRCMADCEAVIALASSQVASSGSQPLIYAQTAPLAVRHMGVGYLWMMTEPLRAANIPVQVDCGSHAGDAMAAIAAGFLLIMLDDTLPSYGTIATLLAERGGTLVGMAGQAGQ